MRVPRAFSSCFVLALQAEVAGRVCVRYSKDTKHASVRAFESAPYLRNRRRWRGKKQKQGVLGRPKHTMRCPQYRPDHFGM